MQENRNRQEREQNIIVENQSRITVTGVSDVDSFLEEEIILSTEDRSLLIQGKGLHICKLDLEEGKVVISGYIQASIYKEKKGKGGDGLLRKLLK